MRIHRPLSFLLSTAALVASGPAWVDRSNAYARRVLELQAKFDPESAGQTGVEGLDEQIMDLKPGIDRRIREADQALAKDLRKSLAVEKDPLVKQDLEILIRFLEEDILDSQLQEKHQIAYLNIPRKVFTGLSALLDAQVPPARRQAALVRLRRYAGLEAGYTPLVDLAIARTRATLKKPGLLGPARSEVEDQLSRTSSFIQGIEKLFRDFEVKGFEPAFATLKEQLGRYQDFVKKEVLPRARKDFRLPPEMYAFKLRQVGVDLPPDRLVPMAKAAFEGIQAQMQTLAAAVAEEKGFEAKDYRDVIRRLKQDQIPNDALLPHYQARLKEIEAIIQREQLLSLPSRPARIRLATAAESAAQPAPHMRPPRLLGNEGEQGEFVLPLSIPAAPGGIAKHYDDFSFAAASWTLTAHEARPGHELQYASIIEQGVSTARALFAFNSTNVEGWGLYAEAILEPYMPAEGRLISLQHRLMRAARAFLDPQVQAGTLTPEAAKRILMEDVVLSDAMATQEVERYTFRWPGQATSYFYGFTRLMELRKEVEGLQGAAFNAKAFHDFVLSQGLLPPDLIRRAVLERFAPKKVSGLGS